MRTFFWALAALAMLCAAQPAKADVLYGATGSGGIGGHLLIIDPATGGVLTDVGPLVDAAGNAYGLTGLAFQPNTGILFGSTSNQSPTNNRHLVTVNPATGLVTDVGDFDPNGGSTMSDITFDPTTGTLYAWRAASGHGLYTVNPATGLATLVGGQTGDFGGGGLAASLTGTLFSTPDGATGSPGGHLNTVNPVTGNPTAVGLLSGGGPVPLIINSMDFNSAGVLFGVQGQGANMHLVTINTATAALTDIGPSASGLDALAFQRMGAPAAVPEPASVTLLGLGAAGLIVAARRRRKQASA